MENDWVELNENEELVLHNEKTGQYFYPYRNKGKGVMVEPNPTISKIRVDRQKFEIIKRYPFPIFLNYKGENMYDEEGNLLEIEWVGVEEASHYGEQVLKGIVKLRISSKTKKGYTDTKNKPYQNQPHDFQLNTHRA